MSKKKKHHLTPPVSGNEADPSAILDLTPDFDDEDDFEEDDEELEEEEEAVSVAPEPEAPAPAPVSEPASEPAKEEESEEVHPLDDIGLSIGNTFTIDEKTAEVLKEANAQIDALIEERDTALAAIALLKSKLVHISCLKISPDASVYNRRSNSLPLTPQEFTMLKNTFQF